MILDYNALKKTIVKNCKQDSANYLNFSINGKKLDQAVSNYGLIFLYNNFKSEQITSANIPLVGEYFKRDKLAWFNRSRHFMTISFVVEDKLDDKGRKLVEMLKDENRSKDPSFDRADIVAELLAYYPCYSATIVSYRSEDPNRIGKNSYTVMVRANCVAIRDEEYQYYNDDM